MKNQTIILTAHILVTNIGENLVIIENIDILGDRG